jgi:hypothetical protein
MRTYRSIVVVVNLLTTAMALANTAFADKIHSAAEPLNYTGTLPSMLGGIIYEYVT